MNINRVVRQVTAALAITSIASCTHSVDSPLVGECLQTVNVYEVWHHPRGQGFIGKYLLASDLHRQIKEGRTLQGTVDEGTRIQVQEVIRGTSGSMGPYLRVIVRIDEGEHQGVIADIPTCSPWHPPKWVEDCGWDPEKISISPSKAIRCPAS